MSEADKNRVRELERELAIKNRELEIAKNPPKKKSEEAKKKSKGKKNK